MPDYLLSAKRQALDKDALSGSARRWGASLTEGRLLEDTDGLRPERPRRWLEVAGVRRDLVKDVVRRIVVDAQLYLAPELVLSFFVPDIAVGRTRQLLEVVP